MKECATKRGPTNKSLVVCSVIGSLTAFRLLRGNAARVVLGLQCIAWAKKQGARLVLFPAGFLRASAATPNDILEAARELLTAARGEDVAIVIGVDTCSPRWANKKALQTAVRQGQLPFFAVAWAPHMIEPFVWRQRSTTSRDWRNAPGTANQEVRTITVAQASIGVVLCGEGFSVPIRQGLVAAHPDLAVLPAHQAGGGLRHWHALRYFRDHGVPAIRSVHAAGGAKNLLWLDGEELPPIAGPEPFQDAGRWLRANVFTL